MMAAQGQRQAEVEQRHKADQGSAAKGAGSGAKKGAAKGAKPGPKKGVKRPPPGKGVGARPKPSTPAPDTSPPDR
jgi:hypothetical protein